MSLLAADVGGTRARFAWVETDGERVRLAQRWTLPTREASGFDELLERVLAEAPGRPRAACFGIAGPISEGRVELTNLGWGVDGAELSDRFDIPALSLVNDLVATGLGLDAVGDDERRVLKAGVGDGGHHAALVSVGTGLGIALLRREGSSWVVTPSEGGHVDFAARNELEWELLRFLRARVGGRVSVERALSGLGLRNLFDFFRQQGLEAAATVVARLGGDEEGAVIAAGARAGCPCSRAAVDLLVSLYGATAGNVALMAAAWGGVYLAGGVTLGLLPEIAGGEFLASFLDKGRLRPMVERVPVVALASDDVALLGAARCALALSR